MLYYLKGTTVARCEQPSAACQHEHHWFLAVPARDLAASFSRIYHLDGAGEIQRCKDPSTCLFLKHFQRRSEAVHAHKAAWDYSGRWRPLPNPYSSLLERELADLVEQLGYRVVRNSRRIIGPYELDLYLPERRVALEFNGRHWHSEEVIRERHGISARAYHETKKALCQEQGIQLGFVWEQSWLCNPVAALDAVAELVQFRRISPLLASQPLPPTKFNWLATDLLGTDKKRRRIEARRAKKVEKGLPFGSA